MLGPGGVGGDIGQVDVGGGDAAQLNLGLLGGLLQALHGHLVAGEVDALGLLELGHQILHDALVEVVAAQAVVAGGGQNLDGPALGVNVQDGHVEGAAAQIVDHDFLVLFLVHAVGQGGGGGLVDDALDLQAGDLAGVLGGLALGVGEVGGDGDDRLGDGLAQIALGVGLELLEDHRGDLLGGVVLAVDGHPVVGAHLPLDGGDGPVGVGDGLALCHLAHHALAGLGEGHHRGGGTVALRVGDDDALAALHDGYAGIGCTEIDTDDFRHGVCPPEYMEKFFINKGWITWVFSSAALRAAGGVMPRGLRGPAPGGANLTVRNKRRRPAGPHQLATCTLANRITFSPSKNPF